MLRILVLALAVGCAAPAPQADKPPVPETTTVKPPIVEKNVHLDEVIAANPVVIRGRARTFENNVALRVRDERGEPVVEDFATAVGEIGHFSPFTAEVWLTRHPGKQITVEAFEYSAKDGSVQSLESRTLPFTIEPIAIKLVLPVEDCTRFETFERIVPKTPAMARLLVEALLIDPRSPFPKGSDVRSVILRDGVLTADFNERLQNVGGSCAAQAIRESVTRTLRQLPSVKRVVITAGGSEALALQP